MKTTLKELSELFRHVDIGQLKAGLVNKIKMIDENHVAVSDERLREMLEKFRKDGVYDLKELSRQYHIDMHKTMYLIKTGVISSFQLVSNKGSKLLFLKTDIEKEKEILLFYSAQKDKRRLARVAQYIMSAFMRDGMVKERDYDMFYKYYFLDKTYEEIAKEFDLSHETVRQIIVRGNRRLLNLVRYYVRCKIQMDEYKKQNEEYEKELLEERLKNKILQRLIVPKKNPVIKLKTVESTIDILSTKLVDYDFNVRLLNRFKAAEINTVGDLILSGKKKMMLIPYFGIKCMEETEKFMKSIGVDFI